MVGEINPTLQKQLPSYLYVQYADDDSLQAFVSAYNTMAQGYLDQFNSLNLPIYTQDPVSGSLLDWVAAGLYGFSRPVFPTINLLALGPFNTVSLNTIPYNDLEPSNTAGNPYYTTDDTFRRVLTWHFFKGDGKVFNIRWLKRRVMRWLFGADGINYNVDQTYRVSVTFGSGGFVNIKIINVLRSVTGGAIFNRFLLNRRTFNSVTTTAASYEVLPEAILLQAAVEGGILELPFQFDFSVTSGGLYNFGPFVYEP